MRARAPDPRPREGPTAWLPKLGLKPARLLGAARVRTRASAARGVQSVRPCELRLRGNVLTL